jgi:monovalent cation:H+ antiporter-2, CPA2 family
MEQLPLLEEIAIVAAAAVVVAIVAGRLRLPTVAGLLLSGALIGPHALGLVTDTHAIEVIAEVGVVLLLFTIGLEFSLSRLKHIFQTVALGGVLQVGGTFGLVVAGALFLGARQGQAVFYGFAVALSSTAIVLRALTERRELDAPHGRFIVGTLIFQDLCVVPMVLIVPLLADGEQGVNAAEIGFALLKASLVVVAVLGGSKLIVPRIMRWVEASGSREIFLLAVLSLCVGTAWLTSLAGLSLALGAFLGGLVVADTEYSHRAMGDMLPLRDVFVSFFFVSLGMLFDARVLGESPMEALLLVLGLILGKSAIATLAALVMRFPPRAAWQAGVGLAQFGEFGFVLVRLALRAEVVQPSEVEPLLAAGIISMFLTPLLLQGAPHITAGERLLAPLARLLRAKGIEEADGSVDELRNHVVVIGYGVAGRLVATTLRNIGVRHVILELNAENVRKGRKKGDPIFYADATSAEAISHAHLEQARCVVIMINDRQAAQRVVDAIRRQAPKVPMVVRTHYMAEHDSLVALGAHRVVVEEVEGGVEVLSQVMRELDIPRNVIEAEIRSARDTTKTTQRLVNPPRNLWKETAALSALKVESVLVGEDSRSANRSLRDLDLRASTGASVIAIQRGEHLQSHPGADSSLEPGDVVYFIGGLEAVLAAARVLEAPREPGGGLS